MVTSRTRSPAPQNLPRQECQRSVPPENTLQIAVSTTSNWNPGKEGAIEKHIVVKEDIITLQEAIEYMDHGFHVTHYGWIFVPSCSTKTLSSPTSRSRPFTYMTSCIPSRTS